MVKRLCGSYLICEIKNAAQWLNCLKTLTFRSGNLLANVLRHFYPTQEPAFSVISLNVNRTYMFITRTIINAHNTLTATAVLTINYKLKALNQVWQSARI